MFTRPTTDKQQCVTPDHQQRPRSVSDKRRGRKKHRQNERKESEEQINRVRGRSGATNPVYTLQIFIVSSLRHQFVSQLNFSQSFKSV